MEATFLSVQRGFERKVGLATLTPEYEIVSGLIDDEWIAPRQFLNIVRMSAATLRYTLGNMMSRGVLASRVNPADSRSKEYRLTDTMRTLVLAQHEGYLNLVRSAHARRRVGKVQLNTYKSYIHKGRKISHLTAEFQILIYLYVAAGLGNHEISEFIDVSPAKFNQSLAELRSRGLIEAFADPNDGRSRQYDLAKGVRHDLDRLHADVAAWLDGKRMQPVAAADH